MDAYEYILPDYYYNRTYPSDEDCYKGTPDLPDGATDISKCVYGMLKVEL